MQYHNRDCLFKVLWRDAEQGSRSPLVRGHRASQGRRVSYEDCDRGSHPEPTRRSCHVAGSWFSRGGGSLRGLLHPELVSLKGPGLFLSPAFTTGLPGGPLCRGLSHRGPHRSLARGHLVPLKQDMGFFPALPLWASAGASWQASPALPSREKPGVVPPVQKITSSHAPSGRMRLWDGGSR